MQERGRCFTLGLAALFRPEVLEEKRLETAARNSVEVKGELKDK